LGLPERISKVEALLAGDGAEHEAAGAVSAGVAHALGLEPACSEVAALEAIEQLRGFLTLNTVAVELGLDCPSSQADCVHAVEALQEETRDRSAEELVRRAVEDGVLKEGQADYWRSRARADLATTKQALDSLRFIKRSGR
jgi:hypothetical protein